MSYRLALTADWLTTFAGAEHAIAEFHTLWPQAPLFTTVARPARLGPLAQADIRTSGLQRVYRVIGKHQLLLPWLPQAMESLDLRGYDAILSSSHAVGKGIVPPDTSVHVCYCHTPMRYAWQMEQEYLRDFGVPKWLQPRVRRLLQRLRIWDMSTASRVDVFIANSTETQARIRQCYGRESVVIPPPVDPRFFQQRPVPVEQRQGFLAFGRLVPYKRFDLLVKVANQLKLPLTIAGTGQESARLRAMAGPTIRFLGYVADADVPNLYSQAKAVLFPAFEDAGIVPLEAQACGTPVIAYGRGGALDTVVDGTTGVFFKSQTTEDVCDAIRRFESLTFNTDAIRTHAEQFAAPHFRERIRTVVEQARQLRSPLQTGSAIS